MGWILIAMVASGCSPDATDATDAPVDADGAATSVDAWPLIDRVSAYQKAGLLMTSGADYRPRLDLQLDQRAAVFTLAAERALFAFAPERGEVDFDAIEIEGLDGPARAWPMVIDPDATMHVWVSADDDKACAALAERVDPFSTVGITGDAAGRLAVDQVLCARLEENGAVVSGSLEAAEEEVRTFGVFLIAEADAIGSQVTIERLALTNRRAGAPAANITVRLFGHDEAIVARTSDASDDAELDILHAIDSSGAAFRIPVEPDGTFAVERDQFVGRALLYVDDVGLRHFLQQGPWVDPATLPDQVVIDLRPTFQTIDAVPEGNDRNSQPHTLRIWNGNFLMTVQDYNGLNWNNNLGRADRERDPANPNGCRRAAWFGGSRVAAEQTRVDQKPGVIAEALLDVDADVCHEVFTSAAPLLSIENHYGDARRLVEEFGVTRLVFSVSSAEVCRLHDHIYAALQGVEPDTPVHWRFVDGEWLEPVGRSAAVAYEVPGDHVAGDVCALAPDRTGSPGGEAMMQKLATIAREFEALGPGVEVIFLQMLDVLDGHHRSIETVTAACAEWGLTCARVPEPVARDKPEELADDNPHLLRYIDDNHPNPRANQLVAEGLVGALSRSWSNGLEAD